MKKSPNNKNQANHTMHLSNAQSDWGVGLPNSFPAPTFLKGVG